MRVRSVQGKLIKASDHICCILRVARSPKMATQYITWVKIVRLFLNGHRAAKPAWGEGIRAILELAGNRDSIRGVASLHFGRNN